MRYCVLHSNTGLDRTEWDKVKPHRITTTECRRVTSSVNDAPSYGISPCRRSEGNHQRSHRLELQHWFPYNRSVPFFLISRRSFPLRGFSIHPSSSVVTNCCKYTIGPSETQPLHPRSRLPLIHPRKWVFKNNVTGFLLHNKVKKKKRKYRPTYKIK